MIRGNRFLRDPKLNGVVLENCFIPFLVAQNMLRVRRAPLTYFELVVFKKEFHPNCGLRDQILYSNLKIFVWHLGEILMLVA